MATLSIPRIRTIFDSQLSDERFSRTLLEFSDKKSIPIEIVPLLGERIGFLKKPARPTVIAVFITKGGVLKTTLTLNIARMAALHNIKTCVVGLDMQGDITSALGFYSEMDEQNDFRRAVAQLESVQGLNDFYSDGARLTDLLRFTDLLTLQVIPETPELVILNQQIQLRNRREYWLKEAVIEPLKQKFDLILLDCSPNWNHLTTNALVACDLLISPLECKINNFRNLKFFRSYISDFQKDLNVHFQHLYVPTKFSAQRKLSRDIYDWYQQHIENCTASSIRESVTGEEACAMHQSLIEYAPKSAAASELRTILKFIWSALPEKDSARTAAPKKRTFVEPTL